MVLCHALSPDDDESPQFYCTRPAGHEGDHLAGVGPVGPGVPILTRWPATAAPAAVTALRGVRDSPRAKP